MVINSNYAKKAILGLALASSLFSTSLAADSKKEAPAQPIQPKEKMHFQADWALKGFNCIDYATDKDTKLQGYGFNPELNLSLSKKCAKGTIEFRLNNEIEKYNGDMTSNGLKMANFNVQNMNNELVLDYITPKGWIFGAGFNSKNRKADVSLEDFNLVSKHSENLKGLMYELGINRKKYSLLAQIRNFEGESNDSIDQNGTIVASNKGYISDGSDIRLNLQFSYGPGIVKPFIGRESYNSAGKIENNYGGLDFEGDFLKNVKAVFGVKQIKTGDSNGYNKSQTQIKLGIKGRFGGYK